MTSVQPSKLKLIYIVTQAEWGGAQRYIFDLATALKDDFDLVVATGAITKKQRSKKARKQENYEFLEKCQEAGIRTHTFKNLVREINPLKDLMAIKELTEFFKQENPDIVHLNSSKAGIIGAWAYRNLQPTTYNLQPKFIYTTHGWVFNEPLSFWRKRLYQWMEKIACRIHDKIIVLSKADFDVAVKNKICVPEKMIIIPHGIKQIDFLPRNIARKKLTTTYNLQPTTLWIGTIANLYKTKGINYLIDAAALLRNQGLEPNFIIIGNGPMEQSHKLQATSYKLNNFHLVGSLEDAAHYLKAFDIFVLPSVKEGMPYALLEAMQAELPIIATSVGAIPGMLKNEVSGFLVQPANSEALAEAIQKLLTNQDIRQNLGQSAAAQFQEKINFEKMLGETSKIYKIYFGLKIKTLKIDCELQNVN